MKKKISMIEEERRINKKRGAFYRFALELSKCIKKDLKLLISGPYQKNQVQKLSYQPIYGVDLPYTAESIAQGLGLFDTQSPYDGIENPSPTLIVTATRMALTEINQHENHVRLPNFPWNATTCKQTTPAEKLHKIVIEYVRYQERNSKKDIPWIDIYKDMTVWLKEIEVEKTATVNGQTLTIPIQELLTHTRLERMVRKYY